MLRFHSYSSLDTRSFGAADLMEVMRLETRARTFQEVNSFTSFPMSCLPLPPSRFNEHMLLNSARGRFAAEFDAVSWHAGMELLCKLAAVLVPVKREQSA